MTGGNVRASWSEAPVISRFSLGAFAHGASCPDEAEVAELLLPQKGARSSSAVNRPFTRTTQAAGHHRHVSATPAQGVIAATPIPAGPRANAVRVGPMARSRRACGASWPL